MSHLVSDVSFGTEFYLSDCLSAAAHLQISATLITQDTRLGKRKGLEKFRALTEKEPEVSL